MTRRARLGVLGFWLFVLAFSIACWAGVVAGGRALWGALS